MQNKLIVLALLGQSAMGAPSHAAVQNKPANTLSQQKAAPTLGTAIPGSIEEKKDDPKDKAAKAPSPPIETLAIPPAAAAIPKAVVAKSDEEKKKQEDALVVQTLGSAAAKLLPESTKEENKDEKSATPLLNDNDQRCYAARFSDLKGAAPLTHYATVGVAQGRLGTCAKELTDYEAQTYLETFPELSQKYGRDSKASWDQARKHYSQVGYLNVHFSAAMKADKKQTTWQCKHNTQCKCAGTLWLGAGKRLDDDKDIENFEDFRTFKTVSKDTSEATWAACAVSQFGADPLPGKEKQCFCEDKPLYVPNLCADDGEDCACEGYVTYGKKTSAGKVLDFAAHLEEPFVLAEVKEGTKSLTCGAEAFGGIDPIPDDKDDNKACFCDNRKREFNKDSLKQMADLWTAKNAIATNTVSITSTTNVIDSMKKDDDDKAKEWKETLDLQEQERKVAAEALEAQKKCVIAAKESAKRYKLEQIRKKYQARKRDLELQRQKLAKWRGQISAKTAQAAEACRLAQTTKNATDKARFNDQCKALKDEVDQQNTEIAISTTQTDAFASSIEEDEAADQATTEGKADNETADDDARAQTQKQEVDAESTETEETVLTDKVDVAQKKLEILKFQEKTQNLIAAALRKKRQALLKIIKLENERMAKLTREEEATVDIEDGEEGEKAGVASKITARAEATITQDTKRVAGYKEKIVYLVTKISTSTTKVVTLREKVTKLKTLIDTKQAEDLDSTKQLRSKQDSAGKAAGSAGIAEIAEAKELREKIAEIEKLLKTTREEYIGVYAEASSLQKLIDYFNTQKRDFEDQIRELEEGLMDQKAIVKEQEEKAKAAAAVAAVTKAQLAVFKIHQEVVETEEELAETKKTKEEKLVTLNAEKTTLEAALKEAKAELKRNEVQKAGLDAALKTTTAKPEVTRITTEITKFTETITAITGKITKLEGKETKVATGITTVTETMTATIEELTKKLAGLKEDAAKDEAAAAKSIETLPGTAGNKTPAGGKKPAGPTTGITDVATTIIKATEEAKNKRTTCARASKRLTNQKDSISVEITGIKDDIEENKKVAGENQDTLKKEHEEYAKTQADANAIASRDPSKYEELTLKLRTLQLQLEQEGKKVNDDEENVERMMSKIKDKNEEVNGLVKFVNDACQDAGQAEEEVQSTIGIVTQIEVVNRLYQTYSESVSSLGRTEKAFEDRKSLYQAQINKYSGNLSEIKRRVGVAEATITTLKAQEAAVDGKAKPEVAKEQELKIKMLISQQEDIIKLETQDQTTVEKALAEVDKEWKATTAEAGKLKRATTRSQEAYEDSQKKLRKQVDIKAKIDEFRNKVATGKKTLEQKFTQITKIMTQIRQEVEENKKKLVSLTEQTEDCSKKTTVARTAITTLSSKQSTLETSSKNLKGADLAKVKKATDKIDAELENAKNQMQVSEAMCIGLKDEITKVTTVVAQFQQEWKYYTQILSTVKKELEDADKNTIKTFEEDKEDDDDDKKTDKNEKNEKVEPNKEGSKKEKLTKSSTSNEVKQTEKAEEYTTLITKQLLKMLDETEETITKNIEKDVESSAEIVKEDGTQAEQKKQLEIITRRKLRQKCAVMFPIVFTQFQKGMSMKSNGMCPCQGGSTGISQISLAVDAPEEADKVVQSLFQKKLVNEAKFLMQVQRTSLGADSKLAVEGEKEAITLVLVANDDKVSSVLTELEEGDLSKKGSPIVSPLLQGKREYTKWVQESLNTVKASASATLTDVAAKDE